MNLAEQSLLTSTPHVGANLPELDAELPATVRLVRSDAVESEGVPLPLAALAVGEVLVTGPHEEQRFWHGLLTGATGWERGQVAEAAWRGLLSGRYKLLDTVRT